jgi:hypothetical protein
MRISKRFHPGSQEAVVNVYDRWALPPILDLVMRQN